jgi:hypothetical protein
MMAARPLARNGSRDELQTPGCRQHHPAASGNPCCSHAAGERVTASAGEPASVWKTTQ